MGGELDVVDEAAREPDGLGCEIQRLGAGELHLVLQMNVGGGEKGVDAIALGGFDGARGGFNVDRLGAGQCGDPHSPAPRWRWRGTDSKSPVEAIGKPAR